MIPEDRRKQILDFLDNKGFVSVEELAGAMYVSVPTIRRDLSALEKEGSIKRTHGGASYVNPIFAVWPFSIRCKSNYEEKLHIGRLAAQLVSSGDKIFIGSSSTCLCFAKALDRKLELNVLTNGIPIAQTLAECKNMAVECPCGQYNAKHASIFGEDACQFIRQRYAKFCFVSCNGIDEIQGVTNGTMLDLAIIKTLHHQAQRTVLLADHTKINEIHYYQALNLSEIDILVTDRPLPPQLSKACEHNHIEILL